MELQLHSIKNDIAAGNRKTIWQFRLDLADFNGDQYALNRFYIVRVEQYQGLTGRYTILKGIHSNWFDHDEKKDKQKAFVVRLVNDWIIKNDKPLTSEFIPLTS